ncbi:MAG: polysaccharide biosynthesis protein, partial [Pirellulales bacterium]
MGKQAIQLGTRLVRVVPNVLWLAPVVVAVYYAAFLLRFEGWLGANGWYVFQATLAPLLVIKLVVFRLLPGFRGWSRMVTFDDLLDLAKAATVCSLVLVVVDHLIMTRVNVPRSIVLIDWGMTIMAIGGLRCVTRLVRERDMTLFSKSKHPAVFIAGVNASGEAVLRAIRRSASLDFRVAGFLAETEQEVGARIGGVPVVGMLADACELSQKHQVREILISADGLPGQQVRALVENAQEAGINVKVLPSYEQLLHGTVDLRPRTVSIEDLLRRDPVELDQRQLHKWIDGKVVMVTGSSGSIGSELCRQLTHFAPAKIVLLDRSETGQFFLERELHQLAPHANCEVCLGDINDAARMNTVFRT